jgi:hypothetical protein
MGRRPRRPPQGAAVSLRRCCHCGLWQRLLKVYSGNIVVVTGLILVFCWSVSRSFWIMLLLLRYFRVFSGSFRGLFGVFSGLFGDFSGTFTGLFGSHLGMIPRMHARDARFYPAAVQARRHSRGRHGITAAAGSVWRGGGGMEAAGKRRRAARRPAGVRRSRHGWSCLLRGGALRARVRERAGHSAAVQVRAWPAKQQHEPT